MRPVLFNQSNNLYFHDQPDEDTINKTHQEQFNTIYGERYVNTGIDQLEETREITTIFAPTPAKWIPGDSGGDYIVPYLSVSGTEPDQDGAAQRLPMTPKMRLLYWNGFVAGGFTWYYTDGTTTPSDTDYPRMTYVSEVPTTSNTLNLNWKKEFAYFELGGGPEGDLGEDVYQRYWESYIDSLYSPEARKLTAYFTIDAEDLRDLSFDDAIFIRDSWWRLLRVYDAPLTKAASVKVDLLKIIDYDPQLPDPPVASFTYAYDAVNDYIQFTDTSTGSPTSWLWTFSAGTPSSTTTQNPTLSGGLFASLTVTLTAINAAGSDLDSQTFTLYPFELPTSTVEYWWRADYGITNGTGSDVAQWRDQISGHDMIQPTAALQPTETTSAALNNRAAIYTDGNATYLYSDLPPASLSNNDFTMLVVWEQVSSSVTEDGGIFGVFWAVNSQAGRMWIDTLNANFRSFQHGFATAAQQTTFNIETPISTGPHSFKFRYDASAGDGYYAYDTITESVQGTTGNPNQDWYPGASGVFTAFATGATVTSTSGNIFLGSGGDRYTQIRIAEAILIYDSATATEMTNYQTYVFERYGLSI